MATQRSIWERLSGLVPDGATTTFAQVIEAVRTVFQGDQETRRRVAFSVALIALSAKMAKADGIVTEDEVSAFRDIFEVPADEFDNVARLYNLARQDVSGFDAYARRVRALFPAEEPSSDAVLIDVLDALFHIAKADGVLHRDELAFLEQVAATFGFEQRDFERILARHGVDGGEGDPHEVLGIDAAAPFEEKRRIYRKRVRETHPDHMVARGVPPEMVTMAGERLAAINAAWDRIVRMEPA